MTRRFVPLAVAAALLFPGAARAEDIRDEVVRALDTRPLRTDFVVLVDTSGSMAKHFDAVRAFVGDLGALAKKEDTITFIAFAERAGDLIPPVTVKSAAGAPELRARLASMRKPRGSFTDLGAGLDATLDALLRPGYAPISIVFLITDFCAEPPPGSIYAGEVIDRGPCKSVVVTEALRKKSKQLFASGDQEVRAFALAIEPTNDRGFAAAAEVLGQLVRVDVAAGGVQPALESLRARMQYDRAALAIEKMLKHPPLRTVASGKIALQSTSRIGLRVDADLPLVATLRLTSLRSTDGSLAIDLSTVDLKPRALQTGVPFSGWLVPARNVPARAPKWTPQTVDRVVELEASYALELQPAAAIEKLIGRAPISAPVDRVSARLPLELPQTKDELVHLAPREEKITLAPGETRDVDFILTSTVGWAALDAKCTVAGEPQAPRAVTPAVFQVRIENKARPNPWRFAKDESQGVAVSADCTIAAVAADGERVPLGTRIATSGVTIVWREGVSLVLIFAAAFSLTAFAFIYLRELRPRLSPAALRGRLVIYDGPGDFRRITVPLRGKTRIELDGVATSDGSPVRVDGDRIVLPGAPGMRAAVYAEKSGKRNVMRLSRIEGDSVMLGDAAVGPTPVKLERGRARFSVGAYHCRIE